MPQSPSHAEFGVGWICALPLELAAATAMLDEVYENLPVQPSDHNTYTLGRIGAHNVAIACLPSGEYGSASAATVAVQLLSSFQSVKFGLLVGIGGGIPSEKADIRLGDVVVGIPTSSSTYGGVVQHDLGKVGQGDTFERTGMLNRPPQILLTAVSKLQSIHQMDGNQIFRSLKETAQKSLALRNTLEAIYHARDFLFDADYCHNQTKSTCEACDQKRVIYRPYRATENPVVHYGLIASGNQVVKDSHFRDHLGRELGPFCVDMEAAGVVNNFPCLVIRGMCDYADSHKNKDWQGYAAAVATAYAKQLLLVTPSETVLEDSYPGLIATGLDGPGSASIAGSNILKKHQDEG
ncbi:nucleoside phosphorylase domain-containing protein [Aspergillus germanicus]